MEVWLSDERASFLQMGQLLAKAKLGRESALPVRGTISPAN